MARSAKMRTGSNDASVKGPRLSETTHVRPPKERQAKGKALREHCPRKSHSGWAPRPAGFDPVGILIEDCKGRLPNLIPIRFGRMLASPFTFYRGAAAVMADDLSRTASTGLNVMACGDCHLLNFGMFATGERRVIFDINDFDEVSIAPWEWDVKRLAASFVIAGRSNGFKSQDCEGAARSAARSYRQAMAGYAVMSPLDAWYDALDSVRLLGELRDPKMRSFYQKKLQAATKQQANEKEFARLAYKEGERPMILDHPPLIYHLGKSQKLELARARRLLEQYRRSLPPERRELVRRFGLMDVAVKVVGVGSVGTLCGVLLLMSGDGSPLFLQLKEARRSVLERYAGVSPYPNHGQRVVVGQHLMQAAGDLFLGWCTGEGGRHFYVRQLRDAKVKPVVETMRPENLENYAGLCGRTLARAHARSGDAVILAAYMGTGGVFDDAIATCAVAYADQTEKDHAALVRAVRQGRVQAIVD